MRVNRIDVDAQRVSTESEPPTTSFIDLHLSDVWDVILRRKVLIIFGFLLGVGLALLYFLTATRQYQSEVQILVAQKDSNLPARGVEEGNVSESIQENLLSTQVQLLRSPRIIRQAIEKHKLDRLESFRAASKTEKHFNPVVFVHDNLGVTKGGEGQAKDAYVLRATYRGPSPEDCAAVLSAIVESYQEFLAKTFQDKSVEAVDLITEAKEQLRTDLAQTEQAYQQFREGAPLFWKGDASSNPHQDGVKLFEQAIMELQLRRLSIESRLKVIEAALQSEDAKSYTDLDKLALISSDDATRLQLMLDATRGNSASEAFLSMQPLRSEMAQTEFTQILRLMMQEREILDKYGPDHPDVKKIQGQIEEARKYLASRNVPALMGEQKLFQPADLLYAHIVLLKNDLRDLDQREAQLAELAEQERKAAKSVVDSEIHNELLVADITRKRNLYDTVVARLSEISLIKDYGGYITEVIAPVEVPQKAVSPVLLLIVGLGSMVGLVFGGTLAYAVDAADRTFRTPEDVRQALQLSIIGDVPTIPPPKQPVAASENGHATTTVSPALVVYHRPRSQESEAFRGLRTALYFGTRSGGEKVIQVTSPNAQDGKTTLTSNLAMSLAQAGKKVLLVDADLRHPSVHRILGIDSSIGLTNVVSGETELLDAVQQLDVDNLWILPSGPCPPNPCELLTSAAFAEFLEVVRTQYDYVLIDSPPLLPVSDSSVIAARVDGVILAIRITKNGAPGAVQARRMLAGVHAHVIGAVVNGFHKDRNFRYGTYGGRYGYGYGTGYGGYGYGGYGYGGYGYGESQANRSYYHDEQEKDGESKAPAGIT